MHRRRSRPLRRCVPAGWVVEMLTVWVILYTYCRADGHHSVRARKCVCGCVRVCLFDFSWYRFRSCRIPVCLHYYYIILLSAICLLYYILCISLYHLAPYNIVIIIIIVNMRLWCGGGEEYTLWIQW